MTVINSAIRLITPADLDTVMAIECDCYLQPWSLQQFLQELENPVSSFLGYELDGVIVGYICYWLVAGEMQILNLATSPRVRRSGIAVQLLQQAFALCLPQNLSSAWLEVRSGNAAAISLYRSNGFSLSGVRRAYYRDGEDALVMVKVFMDQKDQE